MNGTRMAADVAHAETEAFVVAALAGARAGRGPAQPLRLLEVGAGGGVLAVRLAGRGAVVTALELDPGRAQAARRRGATVLETDFVGPTTAGWPAPGSFDAVLFTRVLHHLDPPALALARAEELLAPGGLVIGDEFAWERADEPGLAWLDRTRAEARSRGLARASAQRPSDTLATWRHHHQVDHHVFRGEEFTAAVQARFEVLRLETAPYLFRYVGADLEDGPEAVSFTAEALAEERRRIAAGTLAAVGLRFVARRREGPAAR